MATSGTLTFAAGTTTGTITVPVNGDTTVEPDETFFVNLSSPTNATIGDGQGLGTILNDDTTISIGNVSVTEGNSGTTNVNFTVTLSAAASVPVTVNYATADGTATAGSDYMATSGTLTFAAGSTTGTISVPVTGDTLMSPTRRSPSSSAARPTPSSRPRPARARSSTTTPSPASRSTT